MAENQVAKVLGVPSSTKVTLVQKEITESDLMSSNALQVDDEFSGLYETSVTGQASVIRPPYDFRQMLRLVYENNTLAQCIEAMEVNIDGTGFEISPSSRDGGGETDEELRISVEEFFREPYPGESLVSQRRKLRRDLEATGNAFIEVIRNPSGDLVFLRPVDAQTMRALRLGDPVQAKKRIKRGGRELSVNVMVRDRAFVQRVGTKTIYFKEYGVERDIDKTNGRWAGQGIKLPAENRGNEIIHLTVHPDVTTPYGVPRWLNQAPSAMGSRKAEELNLEYFNSGGIPPVIVFLAGGALSEDATSQLKALMSGKAANATRGAVIEAQSTSGTVDSAGNVRVQVERFGSDRQSDSMFENYDEKCERRVRGSFRLPPLFVGKAEDYSFATAFASYAIAETQVFKPERDEFDKIINVTVMRELDPEGEYVFRSKGLEVHDSELKMRAIEMASSKQVLSKGGFISAINEVANLDLEVAGEDDDVGDELLTSNAPPAPAFDAPPANAENGGEVGAEDATPVEGASRKTVAKTDPFALLDLAQQWMDVAGVRGDKEVTPEERDTLTKAIENLTPGERVTFDSLIAARSLSAAHHDMDGAVELAGCAMDILGHDCADHG
jgi:PBSX family phage portal protein